MAKNCKRGQGSSWTVAPAEDSVQWSTYLRRPEPSCIPGLQAFVREFVPFRFVTPRFSNDL
jgi:hypothetical protein